MGGTFLYLHGTGVQNAAENAARIRRGLAAQGDFSGWTVSCPPWAEDVGPPDLDVLPALPESYQGRVQTSDAAQTMEGIATELYAESVLAGNGIATEGVRDLAMHLLTNAIASHRLGLTNSFADFVRNVVFYLREDTQVQAYAASAIDTAIAEADGPVVVAGHSLGGVIAVDVLTQRPRDVSLLVTAGSQSPLFYLMGAMPSIRRDPPRRSPFSPWLNILNPRDPLAFRAGAVFDWSETAITDVELATPVDLVGAHAGYFDEPRLYEVIASRLAELAE